MGQRGPNGRTELEDQGLGPQGEATIGEEEAKEGKRGRTLADARIEVPVLNQKRPSVEGTRTTTDPTQQQYDFRPRGEDRLDSVNPGRDPQPGGEGGYYLCKIQALAE